MDTDEKKKSVQEYCEGWTSVPDLTRDNAMAAAREFHAKHNPDVSLADVESVAMRMCRVGIPDESSFMSKFAGMYDRNTPRTGSRSRHGGAHQQQPASLRELSARTGIPEHILTKHGLGAAPGGRNWDLVDPNSGMGIYAGSIDDTLMEKVVGHMTTESTTLGFNRFLCLLPSLLAELKQVRYLKYEATPSRNSSTSRSTASKSTASTQPRLVPGSIVGADSSTLASAAGCRMYTLNGIRPGLARVVAKTMTDFTHFRATQLKNANSAWVLAFGTKHQPFAYADNSVGRSKVKPPKSVVTLKFVGFTRPVDTTVAMSDDIISKDLWDLQGDRPSGYYEAVPMDESSSGAPRNRPTGRPVTPSACVFSGTTYKSAIIMSVSMELVGYDPDGNDMVVTLTPPGGIQIVYAYIPVMVGSMLCNLVERKAPYRLLPVDELVRMGESPGVIPATMVIKGVRKEHVCEFDWGDGGHRDPRPGLRESHVQCAEGRPVDRKWRAYRNRTQE